MKKDSDLFSSSSSEDESANIKNVQSQLDEKNGEWRTICGRKVFIAKGQSLTEAMKASGKFSQKVIDAVDKNETDTKKQQKKKERGTITDKEFAEFLGEEFKGVKGQAAVEKIASEKCGHVKGAFTREDIGDIDLLWGDENAGLQHIIQQREAQGIDANAFMSDITEVVEQGTFGGAAKAPDSFILRTKDKTAIIGYTYRGNDLQYILTDFPSHGKKKPPQ